MHDQFAVSLPQTVPTIRDCVLQFATGLLMVAAATLVLVHSEVGLAAAYAVNLDAMLPF
jgi:type III secretory pathway component EscS